MQTIRPVVRYSSVWEIPVLTTGNTLECENLECCLIDLNFIAGGLAGAFNNKVRFIYFLKVYKLLNEKI
jgi:hypothetical protein